MLHALDAMFTCYYGKLYKMMESVAQIKGLQLPRLAGMPSH